MQSGLISRHITTRVCSLCCTVEYLQCAWLLVAQLPVLFEKLPVDFAADVEHGIGCVWFEFAADVFGLHLVLKILQRLALLFCEQVAVLGK